MTPYRDRSQADPVNSGIARTDRDGIPSAARRGAPAWLVGLTGLAIGVAIALRVLVPQGMDPTVFLALGEDSSVQTDYAQRLLGDVRTRRDLGHDGRFFFPLANDPWFLEEGTHATVLDRPLYRAQRMLFPMVAGGFGLFPPTVVVWAMLLTNLFAMGVGAFLAAKLAEAWGASTWLGLWVPLNIGVLFELDIGGAGILAYACCLGAMFALVKDRVWSASVLFAAACLSKELMLAVAVGVFLLWWYERRAYLWRILVVPVAAMAVWALYTFVRLRDVAGTGGNTGNFGAPVVGLVEAVRSWFADPLSLVVSLVLVAALVALVPLAYRSRRSIVWGALPFAGLVVFLTANVLREPFDFARAILPVFTAIPFAIMLRNGEGGSRSRGPAEARP